MGITDPDFIQAYEKLAEITEKIAKNPLKH